MRSSYRIGILLLLSTLISGCFAQPTQVIFPTPRPTDAPTQTPVSETPIPDQPTPTDLEPSPTLEQLPTVSVVSVDLGNESYLLEGSTDPVQLIDGKYKNNEDEISLILSDFTLDADLDQDSDMDAAAILSLDTGGTGVFSMLSVLLNDDGKLSAIYPYIIDDRVKITSLSVADGIIRVDYLGRADDQPMSDEPTVPLTRNFTVSESELTEVDENGTDLVQSFAVSGTVTYLQKIALLPEAEINIKLVDISKADVPASLIEELSFTADGEQPPFQFVLPYNPDVIDPESNIVIEARITQNGKLIFANTKTYPVITRGNPSRVELVLDKIE